MEKEKKVRKEIVKIKLNFDYNDGIWQVPKGSEGEPYSQDELTGYKFFNEKRDEFTFYTLGIIESVKHNFEIEYN